MDIVLQEAASLVVRWLHIVAGICWIGSSFYFVALDLSLKRRAGLPEGASGEAWQVHGGGFYNMVKFMVAPARMPDELAWFKWEAYTTLLSGLALLVIVYYLNAELFLIDRSVMALTPLEAVGLSVAGIAIGWHVYDSLCKSRLGRHDGALGLIGYALLVGATWGYTRLYGGRGAFIQMGAMIGTIMVLSVFATIIPNQRKVVADLIAGRTPDPALGAAGKQRSVHNNYLTLPVVFLMFANHYPLVFATRFNWLIVAIVLAIGPVIRHFFNARHAGQPSPWWTWGVAAAGIVAIVWLTTAGPAQTPQTATTAASAAPPPHFDDVVAIVSSRCSMCHAAEPIFPGIRAAPKGVLLDAPERIYARYTQVALQAAYSAAMPPGNISAMTAAERATIAAWIEAGAHPF
jgi:uncharacterized membrane protein